MPIVTFSRSELPSGFSTATKFFKIEQAGAAVTLYDMTCKHRGGPLTHGRCAGKHIVCPWHDTRVARQSVERRAQPSITTPQVVMFVVSEAPRRQFQCLPLDSSWRQSQ